MRQNTFNLLILIAVASLVVSTSINIMRIHDLENKEEDPVEIKLEQPEFLISEVNEEHLKKALEYYEILSPEIVFAQVILETGNFKSKVCKDNNNLFGLYDSRNNRYYYFSHWTESVEMYKNKIQNRYDSAHNYYVFLKRIGYAEDKKYIDKIKKLVDKNEKDKSDKR